MKCHMREGAREALAQNMRELRRAYVATRVRAWLG